jgi:hypothetical protein
MLLRTCLTCRTEQIVVPDKTLKHELLFHWPTILQISCCIWPFKGRSWCWIESYVTTDGQLASSSSCQAPIWAPLPDFLYMPDRCGLVAVACPVTRGWVCSSQLLLGLASAVILGSESRRTHEFLPNITYIFSSSETGSTQPREYNWGATWTKYAAPV